MKYLNASLFLICGTLAAAAHPQLRVEPQAALITEPVALHMDQLQVGETYHLQVEVQDESGTRWMREVAFTAEAERRVMDPAQERLFALMETATPIGPFAKRNPVPLVFHFTLRSETGQLSNAFLVRHFQSEGLRVETINRGEMRGKLYRPPVGKATGAGVVLVGGSEGGIREERAAMLATRGITTFAMALFAYEGRPDTMSEIPIEMCLEAIAFLEADAEVEAGRVSFFGASRGGELALIVGLKAPTVAGIIAYTPSHKMGAAYGNPRGSPPLSAWTWQGQPLPNHATLYSDEQRAAMDAVDWTGEDPMEALFQIRMTEPERVAEAIIPIERISAPVLIATGKIDMLWPSYPQSRYLAERAKENGKADVQLFAYPKTGHALPFPNLPVTVSAWTHPVTQRAFDLGGEALGIAAASEDLWPRVVEFLLSAGTE